MQGWERAINTISVQRPQLHNTNPLNEREKENSRGQNESEQLDQWKGIGPAIEIRQSHTV